MAMVFLRGAVAIATVLAQFNPESAQPHFRGGAAGEAARHFRLAEFVQAADGFIAYVKGALKSNDVQQARFIAAYSAQKAGRFNDAASLYEQLVASYPLLIDHHCLGAARAHLAAGRTAD